MEKIANLMARYTAKKPQRPCDDHETWEKAWRRLQEGTRRGLRSELTKRQHKGRDRDFPFRPHSMLASALLFELPVIRASGLLAVRAFRPR